MLKVHLCASQVFAADQGDMLSSTLLRSKATFTRGTLTTMLRLRTIPASVLQLHKGTLWVVSSLALFVAGNLIFGNPSDSPDGARHALAHLYTGVPFLLLALAAYRLWGPRNPIMQVSRVMFVMIALVIGAGQLEHSVGVYVGDPLHIVGKMTPSQVAVVGLGILLAIANVVKAWRSRVQQRSSQT